MFKLTRHHAALVCAALLTQGCAHNGPLYDARNQFFSGQPEAALVTLETETVANRNRLLAQLDHGLIAHTAGNYQQSIDAFKSAAALVDELNVIGVREQTATLVTNDWVSAYKGEYSERLWIHSFQMMNFLLLNDPEGAAVEARQALQIFDAHGDHLRNDWYTRALIAMSFEAAGKADSAHIEYKKLLLDAGRDVGLARRAWRNAKRLGRQQDADKFKDLITTSATTSNTKGELVVFVQTGSIPHKVSGNLFIDPTLYASFPVYPLIPRPNINLSVSKNGDEQTADVTSVQLVDISRAALSARGKQIATKQVLRLAAKKGVTDAVSGENELLGAILQIAFLTSEIADTRSWETLPAHLSMVQLPLDAGTHSVSLQIRDGSNFHVVNIPDVTIASGRTSYRSFRVGSGEPRPVIRSTAIENVTSNVTSVESVKTIPSP